MVRSSSEANAAAAAWGGDCCYTFSKVKRDGNRLVYESKATAPSTTDNFDWGYVVKKEDVEVQVDVQDTHDPKPFFVGHYPPLGRPGWTKAGKLSLNTRSPVADSSTDSDLGS